MRERELDRLRARFLRGRPRARCVHLRGRRFARRRAARLARHEHRAGPENEGGGDADAERDEQRGEKIDDDRTYPGLATRSFHLRSPCESARFGPCLVLKRPKRAPPGGRNGKLPKNCGGKMAARPVGGRAEKECAIFSADLFPLLPKEGWREAPGWFWRDHPAAYGGTPPQERRGTPQSPCPAASPSSKTTPQSAPTTPTRSKNTATR